MLGNKFLKRNKCCQVAAPDRFIHGIGILPFIHGMGRICSPLAMTKINL